MRFVTLILSISLIMIGVSFAFLNASLVKINYYFGEKEIALSLILVGTLCCGVLIGLISNSITILKLKYENRKLQK